MRVEAALVKGGVVNGVLLYKDTLGIFLRLGKICKFIPWEEIVKVKSPKSKEPE